MNRYTNSGISGCGVNVYSGDDRYQNSVLVAVRLSECFWNDSAATTLMVAAVCSKRRFHREHNNKRYGGHKRKHRWYIHRWSEIVGKCLIYYYYGNYRTRMSLNLIFSSNTNCSIACTCTYTYTFGRTTDILNKRDPNIFSDKCTHGLGGEWWLK